MSTGAALTVIAIALSVMALLLLGAVVVLAVLVAHLRRLEQSIAGQLSLFREEAHQVVTRFGDVSKRLEATAARAENIASAAGSALGIISGLLSHRRSKAPAPEPWWESAGKLAWSLYRHRTRTGPALGRRQAPPASGS